MSARTEMAAAATGVDGVNVTPYYRQSLKPGDGCVRLAQRVRDGSGLGFIDTWEIWLAVSQDLAGAEKWLEANLSNLLAALGSALYVTTITPSELVLSPGGPTTPGVIVAGTREDTF